MAKKNNLNEIRDDFVSKLFRAIGKGLKPTILKRLVKKNPEFDKLVKDLEKSKVKANSLVQAYLNDNKKNK